jgi:PAS domain S-box-containing protein
VFYYQASSPPEYLSALERIFFMKYPENRTSTGHRIPRRSNQMKKKTIAKMSLKVLYLEDSPQDIEIVRELLIDAGYDLSMDCAEKKSEFTSLLRSHIYDIILSDFKLPGFNAIDALKLSNEICPEVPFICISGVIGEETVVEIIKKGAVDCVLKDRLVRLPSAIERALDEVKKKRSLRIAEGALQESEERMRALVEGTPYLFFYTQDGNANTTYVSPTVEQITGYKIDIWKKRKDWFITAAEFNQIAKEKTRAHLRGEFTKEPILVEVCHANGNRILLEAYEYPIMQEGKVVGLQGIAHDITDRKRAEEALAEEKRRLSYILEGTNVGTWEWNIQTGERIYNERWAEIIGYTLEELAPISADTRDKFTHPDDVRKSKELVEKHFNKELEYYECETRMRHKNGSWVWVLDRGKVATWTNDGKPLTMSGTHQDITKRKRAEEKANQLAAIVQSSEEAIVGKDLNGIITSWNKGAEKIYGYTESEVIGRSISLLIPTKNKDELQMIFARIKSGENIENFETIRRKKDGQEIQMLLTMSSVLDTEGKIIGVSTVGSDITERKLAEQALWKTTIEREKLIKELQFALDNVKTLQGLIPICASCKKIRDDKGFWNQVEGYISEHTDAKFTHGICPDCAKELYGDVYDIVNEDQKKKIT